MLSVVDIVHGLVIGKVRRQLEETSEACSGGRLLKVGRREDTEDRGRHIVERSVLADTVVDVNGTDFLRHTVIDLYVKTIQSWFIITFLMRLSMNANKAIISEIFKSTVSNSSTS